MLNEKLSSTALHRASEKPKCQRKMFTIAEKIKLLDMLKQGKSYAAVGRCYGINESSVRYIKKDEINIRATAAVSVSKTTKRIVTPRNRAIITMEAELVSWIKDCRQKHVPLTTNVICSKAKTIFQKLSDSIRTVTDTTASRPARFNASNGWYEKFQKRHGLRSILYGEPASSHTINFNGKENDANESLTAKSSQHKTEQVCFNETVYEDEYEESEQKLVSNLDNVDIEMDHLTTIVTLTKEIQRMTKQWDPLKSRSLKFSNTVNLALSVYEELLAEKKKQDRILSN